MHNRLRSALVAAALLSVLTGAVADVVPRYNNCPRGYYPDGNFCVSQSDRPHSQRDYGPPPGARQGPYEGSNQGRHSGGQSYQQGPPIIEKYGNCPPGYHSNRKGKKCVRDGYED